MSKWRCNSCQSVYSDVLDDGVTLYFHACSPDVIQHAVCDAQGNVTQPEVRTPRADLRDENQQPGLCYVEGKVMREVPDPETPGRVLLKEAAYAIVAEGAGRTKVA